MTTQAQIDALKAKVTALSADVNALTPDLPVVVVAPTPPVIVPPTGIQRVQIGEDEGPTWLLASDKLFVPWKNPGGDWVDSKGVSQGKTPYAIVPKAAQNGAAKVIAVEVGPLVEKLRTDNTGFMVHRLDPNAPGTVNPAAFSANRGDFPRSALTVVTDQGTFTAPLLVDTCVAQDSAYSQGGGKNIYPPAMLRFDLSGIKGAVRSATLGLSYIAYGGEDLAVDFLDMPELLTRPAVQHPERVERGLAARVGEAGLAAHPSVLVYADATKAGFDAGFQNGWNVGGTSADTAFGKFPDLAVNSMRLFNSPAGSTAVNQANNLIATPGGNRNPQPWQQPFGAGKPTHLFLRYLLHLERDVMAPMANGQLSAHQGAKIPALSGNFGNLNAPIPPGWGFDDGWGLSLEHGLPSPLNGYAMPFASYLYDMDKKLSNPDRGRWTPTGAALIREHTYTIEMEVQMNAPTKNDGVLRLWLDGVKVSESLTVRYRDRPEGTIMNAIMLYMNGGNDRPDGPQHMQIGGWTLATEYIGPPKR